MTKHIITALIAVLLLTGCIGHIPNDNTNHDAQVNGIIVLFKKTYFEQVKNQNCGCFIKKIQWRLQVQVLNNDDSLTIENFTGTTPNEAFNKYSETLH